MRLMLLPVILIDLVQYKVLEATAVFIVMLLTDVLDGNLARMWNSTSTFGAFLDHGTDKLISVTLSWVAYQYYGLPSWAFYLVLIRELAVVAGGLHLWRSKGRNPGSNIYGKVAGTVLLVAVYSYILDFRYKEALLLVGIIGIIAASFGYLLLALRYTASGHEAT